LAHILPGHFWSFYCIQKCYLLPLCLPILLLVLSAAGSSASLTLWTLHNLSALSHVMCTVTCHAHSRSCKLCQPFLFIFSKFQCIFIIAVDMITGQITLSKTVLDSSI
jgi:hypothetical protein